jgi:flavin-dependent dehydrogenase
MICSVLSSKNRELLARYAQQQWDAIVVGAGPAGSIAARQLACQGKRVLLVDKATFPRRKVCGGCLNPEGIALLAQIGLADVLSTVQAQSLKLLTLHYLSRQVTLSLAGNVAVARDASDNALASAAVAEGACLLTGVEARADVSGKDCRWVQLSLGRAVFRARARIVIVAAGLNGWRETDPRHRRTPLSSSRIGVGTILRNCPAFIEPNVVHMLVNRRGYVGMVRLSEGQLDIAAAFDKDYLSTAGGPAAAVAKVLGEVGHPYPNGLRAAHWFGTPPFTHQLRYVAAPRTFFIGDAAGYVEPFTGEGMTWALQSAHAVTNIAIRAIETYQPSHAMEWQSTYRRLLGRKMFVCGLVGKLLRHPFLAHATMMILSRSPWLALPIIRSINHSRLSHFSQC